MKTPILNKVHKKITQWIQTMDDLVQVHIKPWVVEPVIEPSKEIPIPAQAFFSKGTFDKHMDSILLKEEKGIRPSSTERLIIKNDFKEINVHAKDLVTGKMSWVMGMDTTGFYSDKDSEQNK